MIGSLLQTVGLVARTTIGTEGLHGGGDACLIGGKAGEDLVRIGTELGGLGLEVIEIFPDRGCRSTAGLAARGNWSGKALALVLMVVTAAFTASAS